MTLPTVYNVPPGKRLDVGYNVAPKKNCDHCAGKASTTQRGAEKRVTVKSMKRGGQIARRTPLRSYTRLHSKNGPQTSQNRSGRTKLRRKSQTSVAKLKRELWELCRKLTFKIHGNDCYTCPAKNLTGRNLHCGHFITKSTCSAELAFSLENLRPQCYRDNIHLSGAWQQYEDNLIRDGIDVAELKRRNQETKGMKTDAIWFQNKINAYRAHYETIRGVETKEVMGSK